MPQRQSPMPCCLSDAQLAQLIHEDVPYLDLTTYQLGIGDLPGQIRFLGRHPQVVAASEEAARLLTLCGATVSLCIPSGVWAAPGQPLLVAEGPAQALHRGWKVAQNMLEYGAGIATRARRLVDAARQANPAVTVATTRKVFPGTKPLAVKSILAGGAVPHRLGLSETILIFPQHQAFLGGLAGLCAALRVIKQRRHEQKIGVEVERLDDALEVAAAGADLLQFDKIDPPELALAVLQLRERFPALTLVAAGGLTDANIAQFAASGVDTLVTTWPYFGKPADIGVEMLAPG